MPQLEKIYKARLVSTVTGRRVIFNVTPDINESGSVEYRSADTIHTPGSVMIYVNTPSRQYGINNIKLVSRTMEEATNNLIDLNLLRSWRMPYFGTRSTTLTAENRGARQDIELNHLDEEDIKFQRLNVGKELLGAPPDILYFSAYSTSSESGRVPTNINRVPVVVTSLTIDYPSDVDYVPTKNGTPFPTMMTISISLNETHAPRELSDRFSIQLFRAGKLTNF